MDKDKILRYYKSTGEDILAARLLDVAETVEKNRKYKASFFLSPGEMQIAEVIANSTDTLSLQFLGGFENAERNKAVFVHEAFEFPVSASIMALGITWDKRYYNIAHKDLMGAILAICKREFLGDIVLTEDGAQVVADDKMGAYLLTNLTSVGATEVSVQQIELCALEQKQEKIKAINATVSTLRLDAVAAAGYGVSRTQMTESIKMQQVKLNHKTAKSPAQEVKAGDVISYRGKGRLEVAEVKGMTKKGRISILVNKIL